MDLIFYEYQRYKCYNFLLKKIEKILSIKNKRVQYENKNILERVVLELINQGISSKVSDENFLFNTDLNARQYLENNPHFIKMMKEYAEKKILITSYQKTFIIMAFISSQEHFKNVCSKYKNETPIEPICKIKTFHNRVVVQYQDYIKTLSKRRYDLLTQMNNIPNTVVIMVMRYSIFDYSGQQWSIGNAVYSHISKLLGITFGLEMFASPLNNTIPRFCSVFTDTDSPFGSLGSFYDLTSSILIESNIKAVLFNPPYLPNLLDKATSYLLQLLEECKNVNYNISVIAFLPNWDDAIFTNLLMSSTFLSGSRIIKKGNYYLKQNHDETVMISNFDIKLFVLNVFAFSNVHMDNIVEYMSNEIKK